MIKTQIAVVIEDLKGKHMKIYNQIFELLEDNELMILTFKDMKRIVGDVKDCQDEYSPQYLKDTLSVLEFMTDNKIDVIYSKHINEW